MTFIKRMGIAELDRNLYLTMRGDNLLSHWQSHLAATVSLWIRQRRDSNLVWSRLRASRRYRHRWPRRTLIYSGFVAKQPKLRRSHVRSTLSSRPKRMKTFAINFCKSTHRAVAANLTKRRASHASLSFSPANLWRALEKHRRIDLFKLIKRRSTNQRSKNALRPPRSANSICCTRSEVDARSSSDS